MVVGVSVLPRNNSGQFDPRTISSQVEELSEEMAVASLNDLPQDDVYDGDESDITEIGKKQRSWLGKMGKGLYRRTIGGKKDTPRDGRSDGEVKALVMACRSPMACESGGVVCQNPADQKVCRSILSLMIKQMGKNLLSGGNVMNVSFPIQCCQPKTVLEIGAAMGQLFHEYMPRAAATTDPIERLKCVVSCFVASMPLTSGNFLKPLNPILGETLQVEYSDGSRLWMEQTCHHPPVGAFLLEAKDREYWADGFLMFSVGFGYNKMIVTPQGERSVHFKDGTTIVCDNPNERITSLFWGQMCHETFGAQTFTDAKNGLRCRLEFGNPSGRKGVPSDFFEGVVERYDVSQPDAQGEDISVVEGSWVGFIDFDGKRYWDLRKAAPAAMRTPECLLRSDSRLRADRLALESGNIELAQEEKVRMEEQQRAERRLREAVRGANR
jgi:hypothetical protein